MKGERLSAHAALEAEINALWERRLELSPNDSAARARIEETLSHLDAGRLRVAEKVDGVWRAHQWLKKAALLSFRLTANRVVGDTPPGPWWDKVALKCEGWTEAEFAGAGFRSVPGAIVRRGAFVAPNVVLMPSFVNVGAYVDEGTMIDTWATVGSCAQIGRGVHLSGGAGIGGVFEPLQANPTIIEDGCFIGARSEVAEGVVVEEGAVLSMGVFISASTKVIDRATGAVHRGRVPAYSVVVPGSLADPSNPSAPALACAVIVKTVDAQTRAKTSVNELLRD